MILIAHRGNIHGPNPAQENHPDYIMDAVAKGFDVELDVRYLCGRLYLGHDEPQYEISAEFLENKAFWCHAKDIRTLSYLATEISDIHYFFHNTDDCTLTSRGYIWTYPGKQILCSKSIAVIPELIPKYDIDKAGGICSDYMTWVD